MFFNRSWKASLRLSWATKKVSGCRNQPSKVRQKITATVTPKRPSKPSWEKWTSRFPGTATGALNRRTWGRQYLSCVKSWEENWDILSTFFAYPAEVRKIIYTTNIIEGLNRQFRQIAKITRPDLQGKSRCFSSAPDHLKFNLHKIFRSTSTGSTPDSIGG